MKKKGKAKFELNLFSITDYRALAEHLEKMALEGWKLEKIGIFIKFREIIPQKIHYIIDIHHIEKHIKNNADVYDTRYFNNQKDNGLVFLSGFDDMQIFYLDESLVCEDVEVENLTIEAEEAYQLQSSSLNRQRIIVALAFFPILLTTILDIIDFKYSMIINSRDFILPIIGILLTISGIVFILKEIPWQIRAKKQLKKGEEISPPARIITIIRKLFIPFIVAIILLGELGIYIMDTTQSKKMIAPLAANAKIVTLADFSVDVDYDVIGPYRPQSSHFIPISYSFMQQAKSADEPFIFTKYYNALNEKIAVAIFEENVTIAREDHRKISTADKAIFDADQACFANDDNSQLIVRKGTEVFILKGSFDFSKPEIAQVCKKELLYGHSYVDACTR